MIAAADITRALAELGVAPTDTLFVHSGLKGALRLAGATREEKLATLAGGLRGSVAGGLLVAPTFTYSFTRGEPFDVRASPSTVGVFSDYVRTLPGVRRTAEPLFSCALLGAALPGTWGRRLLRAGDVDCFGPDSVFAYLLEVDAKLLFLGVDFEMCTFVYHVEQLLRVPYRYFKDFHGTVVDADGEVSQVTARYFVRDLEADVENTFAPLARGLLAAGRARAGRLERGPELLVTSARAVHDEIEQRLAENPDFLLRRGHPRAA
ncbi:MAG TPA: AAC(3) family N-acetyltransferase [Gaiellales bacterium]